MKTLRQFLKDIIVELHLEKLIDNEHCSISVTEILTDGYINQDELYNPFFFDHDVLIGNLEECIYQHEEDITYYDEAISYLTKYDKTLEDSCQLAHEYGYEAQQLNSTLLASLLKTHKAQECLHEAVRRIKDHLKGTIK